MLHNRLAYWIYLILQQVFLVNCQKPEPKNDENSQLQKLTQFLKETDELFLSTTNERRLAIWGYSTNMNAANKAHLLEVGFKVTKVQYEWYLKAKKLDTKYLHGPASAPLLRQLKILMTKFSTFGVSEEDKILEMKFVMNLRQAIANLTICGFKENSSSLDCSKRLNEADIQDHMKNNAHDYERLQKIWRQKTDRIGAIRIGDFKGAVDIMNKRYRDTGHKNVANFWNLRYEDNKVVAKADALYFKILPLYENLYAYVQRRMQQFYKTHPLNDVLYPHIVGSSVWTGIEDIVLPYPNVQSINLTAAMIEHKYDVKKILHHADSFFQSLGMAQLPESFWTKSVFEKPTDGRLMEFCLNNRASSWNFHINNDVRMFMCGNVTENFFYIIYREMGRLQNFMLYNTQPFAFQEAASPAFEEAIGNLIFLSARTPAYLQTIRLITSYEHNSQQEINDLMKIALRVLPWLSYTFSVDKWRYGVFNGTIEFKHWNRAWWDVKIGYQGLVNPAIRTSDEFDAGDDGNIMLFNPLLQYFLSTIVQFQLYKAMCTAANHQGPLHQCNFYQNKKAGALLMNGLKLGSSKPWPEVLKVITGQTEMDATQLLEYFKPLDDWLTVHNQKDSKCYGWGKGWPCDVFNTLQKPRCKRVSAGPAQVKC